MAEIEFTVLLTMRDAHKTFDHYFGCTDISITPDKLNLTTTVGKVEVNMEAISYIHIIPKSK